MNTLNKILIVGHESSRYREVERLLTDCGMQPAKPSRREALTPAEVNELLLNGHAPMTLSEEQSRVAWQQVRPTPIWNGVALDLMLGNVTQPLWGWADPNSIRLLDYWKTIDPSIAFIMVYDNLSNVVTSAGADIGEEELQRRVSEWVAYNASLLHFYQRNRERSLLVHAQQVRCSVERYIEELRARTNAPLVLPSSWPDMFPANETAANDPVAISLVHGSTAEVSAPIREFLADSLHVFSEAKALYDELQAAASLPRAETGQPAASSAWRALAMLDRQLAAIKDVAIDQRRAIETRAAENAALVQRLQEQGESHRKQLASTQTALDGRTAEVKALAAEKAKLGLRITDLERNAKRGGAEIAALRQQLGTSEKTAAAQAGEIRSLQSEKSSLQARHVELERQSEAAAADSELLLNQLHAVQQEFERYHEDNRTLKHSLRAARRARRRVYTGAADRIRGELNHRLGSTLLRERRSLIGLLKLPWTLLQERQAFLRDQAAAAIRDLPPLADYSDAPEGELVMRDLPYRLGAVISASGRNPVAWLKLPFLLRREVGAFRRERNAS